jgi:hypothetical protein
LAKELTEVQAPETILTEKFRDPWPKADPYPNKTPTQIVGRSYLILQQDLADSGQIVFYPHDLLYQDKTVLDYLKLFRYFRSGVKLQILCTSTQSQFGSYLVSTLPYCQSATRWLSNTQMFQADGHLLDITEEEGITLELPYVSPDLYFDLN